MKKILMLTCYLLPSLTYAGEEETQHAALKNLLEKKKIELDTIKNEKPADPDTITADEIIAALQGKNLLPSEKTFTTKTIRPSSSHAAQVIFITYKNGTTYVVKVVKDNFVYEHKSLIRMMSDLDKIDHVIDQKKYSDIKFPKLIHHIGGYQVKGVGVILFEEARGHDVTHFFPMLDDFNDSRFESEKLEKTFFSIGEQLGALDHVLLKNLKKRFVHGDSHTANMMYDAKNNQLYWIDYTGAEWTSDPDGLTHTLFFHNFYPEDHPTERKGVYDRYFRKISQKKLSEDEHIKIFQKYQGFWKKRIEVMKALAEGYCTYNDVMDSYNFTVLSWKKYVDAFRKEGEKLGLKPEISLNDMFIGSGAKDFESMEKARGKCIKAIQENKPEGVKDYFEKYPMALYDLPPSNDEKTFVDEAIDSKSFEALFEILESYAGVPYHSIGAQERFNEWLKVLSNPSVPLEVIKKAWEIFISLKKHVYPIVGGNEVISGKPIYEELLDDNHEKIITHMCQSNHKTEDIQKKCNASIAFMLRMIGEKNAIEKAAFLYASLDWFERNQSNIKEYFYKDSLSSTIMLLTKDILKAFDVDEAKARLKLLFDSATINSGSDKYSLDQTQKMIIENKNLSKDKDFIDFIKKKIDAWRKELASDD